MPTPINQQIHLNLAHWNEAAQASRTGWRRAVAHGRDRQRDRFAAWLANAVAWGSTPVVGGLATINELLQTTTRRSVLGALYSSAAQLCAYADDRAGVDAAWNSLTTIFEELGRPIAFADFRRLEIERALGSEFSSALPVARRLEARFASTGETSMRSTVVVMAGWICMRSGDDAETWGWPKSADVSPPTTMPCPRSCGARSRAWSSLGAVRRATPIG
jgi:hypothetical protein